MIENPDVALADTYTAEPGETECESCGHIFKTRAQRVEHERRRSTRCPCGEDCGGDPDA